MLVKRTSRIPVFQSALQFFEPLNLNKDTNYLFEFNYLINYDKCDPSKVQLKVYLYDMVYFEDILFDSTTVEKVNNRMWNNQKQIFKVFSGSYSLAISATSICEISDNEAFVAIDDISIRKISEQTA